MKTKIFFVIGLLMLGIFVAYALLGGFFNYISLWHVKETWNVFYIYSAIMIAIFLLPAVIHIIEFVRKDDTVLNMLAAVCGSIGCSMFGFGLCFFWYAINRPQMGTPFGLELTRFIYNVYIIITILMLISAIVLKIAVVVTNVIEKINMRKAKK